MRPNVNLTQMSMLSIRLAETHQQSHEPNAAIHWPCELVCLRLAQNRLTIFTDNVSLQYASSPWRAAGGGWLPTQSLLNLDKSHSTSTHEHQAAPLKNPPRYMNFSQVPSYAYFLDTKPLGFKSSGPPTRATSRSLSRRRVVSISASTTSL